MKKIWNNKFKRASLIKSVSFGRFVKACRGGKRSTAEGAAWLAQDFRPLALLIRANKSDQ